MLLSKTSNVKLKSEGCSHRLRMPQGKLKHCMPFGIYKEMTGKWSLIDVVNELYLGARSGHNTAKHQCRSLFLIGLYVVGLRPATLFEKIWHGLFPAKFTKFWRTLFLQNSCGRLLLNILEYWLPESFSVRDNNYY